MANALRVGTGSVRFELGVNKKLSLGGNGSFEVDKPDVVGGRFIVTEGGNVGIGKASPGAKLEVAIADNDASTNLLAIGKGALPYLMMLNNGNVGIGTTSPGTKLEVANYTLDDMPFQLLLRLQAHSKDESNSNVFDESKPSYGIEFYRKWNNTSVNSIQAGIYAWPTGNVGSGLAFRTKPSVGVVGTLTTRMVITDGGNVGIGTTSPGAKLEVVGQTKLSGSVFANGDVIMNGGNVGIGTTAPAATLQIGETIAHRNNYDLSASKLLVRAKDHNGGKTPAATQSVLALVREGVANEAYGNMVDFRLGRWEHVAGTNNSRSQLDIYLTEDSFVPKPVMSLRANGNVGIGTTDPGDLKLKVQGNAHITGTLWANSLVHYWAPDNMGWVQLDNRSGDFTGNVRIGGPSDLRFKTALRPIRNALEKVLQLHGKCYRWGETGLKYFTQHITETFSAGPDATEEENHKLWETERRKAYQVLSGENIGLVAQDVETVVPEVVHQDEAGYKYIRYQQLVALLVEAVKEQNALIQALSAKVAAL